MDRGRGGQGSRGQVDRLEVNRGRGGHGVEEDKVRGGGGRGRKWTINYGRPLLMDTSQVEPIFK